jgi:hypothetical protein
MSDFGVPGARFVGDDVYDRYEARLRRRATTLIFVHRETIKSVARALLEHGTLSADQIDALVE